MSRLKLLFNLVRTIAVPAFQTPSVSRLKCLQSRWCSQTPVVPSEGGSERSPFDPVGDLDLSGYGSTLLPSYNFAAYADRSVALQELIKLGVELYKIERNPKAAEFILKLDYHKNIKPHLTFLHDNGVPADKLGEFVTRNPFIFKEDLEDMEVRINYLKSKKFTPDMISNIITLNPHWLSVPVREIDKRLGFLQTILRLKGDEVRQIVSGAPKLGTLSKRKIELNLYVLREEMGLDNYKVKDLVLKMPLILRKDEYDTVSTYEYLTKQMKVSEEVILEHPKVLTCRRFLLKERHQFLVKLGRAQYNPRLPAYVSLTDLCDMDDSEFCEKIAKTSVLTYNDYLKTL